MCMSNELSTLIQQQLSALGDEAIWVIEENSQALQLEQFATLHCKAQKITNRVDLANCYQARFSDFDLSPLLLENTEKPKHVVFRIAKEKAVNLHIIRCCLQQLNVGSLSLYGFKNDGIKSLLKLIKSELDDTLNVHSRFSLRHSKHGKQLTSIHIESQDTPCKLDAALNPQSEYLNLQPLHINDYSFYSKPGQFGWKKIDLGSQLLIEQLGLYLQSHSLNLSSAVLDLGCGYGFLSIAANALGFNTIDATDNCAAALHSCQENFKTHSIKGTVITDDCAANISTKYDIILCNPPFHHGFDHDTSLTEKFVQRSANCLKKDGKAFFVVNEFVGIEKEANKHFTKQQLLDKKNGFKIIMLSH